MKKKLFSCLVMNICMGLYAQQGYVGINTSTPKATLDVVGNPALTSHFDGIIAPRLTGEQLRAKIYTPDQTGALVYVTAADPAPAGQTVNVTAAGYYHFNGTVWVTVTDVNRGFHNLYTSDGTLPAVNRTVTLANRTSSKLTIAPAGEVPNISTLNIIGGSTGATMGITIADNFINNANKFSYLKTVPFLNSNPPMMMVSSQTTSTENNLYVGGINSASQASPTNIFFRVDGDTNLANHAGFSVNAMTIVGVSGNVGIGTTTPKSKLEVDGIIASGVQVVSSGSNTITKTVVDYFGGTATLPRAQDNPGAIIFVNNKDAAPHVVDVAAGGGSILFGNSTTPVPSVTMDGSGTNGTKSLLFISNAQNWIALKFAN